MAEELNQDNLDIYLDLIKSYQSQLEELDEDFKAKKQELEDTYNQKKEEITQEKDRLSEQLKEYIMENEEIKETKTQYKANVYDNEVIIEKPKKQLKKPKLDEETIQEKYRSYAKSKVDLDWTKLKKNLIISGDQVVNVKTGEILDDIPVEQTNGRVYIK